MSFNFKKISFIVILLLCFIFTGATATQYFFVVDFTVFKSGEVEFNSIKLLQGDEPIFPESQSGYSFKIRDQEQNIITQKTFNFEFQTEVDTEKGYLPVDIDRIDGFTRMPYNQNAETLEVTDQDNKVLIKTYLKDYICKDDGLCPSVCRGTFDNDCHAQGKCGDGICQMRYENEKTCALDCMVKEEESQIEIDDQNNQNEQLPEIKKRPTTLAIFIFIFLIITLGAYIYIRKTKKITVNNIKKS